MSEVRPPTEKEKRIINRLALKEYEARQSHSWMQELLDRHSRDGPSKDTRPEFRLPYPEADVEESPEGDESRKSSHDLLIESLGGKCQVCGSTKDLEAHHVIPLAKGGPDAVQNLVILCRECHTKTF